ncbi:unnamed protein product [Rodentolepis nana]|uniref:UBC core domain-containing protein n=1 Tax=Rodentolepis nana TaxID=102285 RepID=A0A0R3TXS0_RODNA|nr:unnamed protein product [Rodentolepis nana]
MLSSAEFRREYIFLTEQLRSISDLKVDFLKNGEDMLHLTIVISGKAFRFNACIPTDYPSSPSKWIADRATIPIIPPQRPFITFTDQLRTVLIKCYENRKRKVPDRVYNLVRSYLRFYFSNFLKKERMKQELRDKWDAYIVEHFNTFLSMADDNIKQLNELTGDEGKRADKMTSLLKACQRIQVRELGRKLDWMAEDLTQPPHHLAQEKEISYEL